MQNARGKFNNFSYFSILFSVTSEFDPPPEADGRFSPVEKRNPGEQTSAGSVIFAVIIRVRFPSSHLFFSMAEAYTPNNYSIAYQGRRTFSPPRASLTTVPDSRNRAMRLGMTIMPLKVSEISHSSPRSMVAPTMATKE